MDIIRETPFDPDAEMSVIGAVLCRPDLFGMISETLSVDDFYDENNKILFTALRRYSQEIRHDGQDYVVLKKSLEDMGVEHLNDFIQRHVFPIMDTVPSVDEASAKYYAKIVKDKSERRRQIDVFENALNGLYDPMTELREIENDVCNSILIKDNRSDDRLVGFDEAHMDYIDYLEKRIKSDDKIPGILTGFAKLDQMTGGLEAQKLYIIGGRPAMGKTAFALNIASNMSKQGKRVALFSLEMGQREIVKRIISSNANIGNIKLKFAAFKEDDSDWPRIGDVFQTIKDRLIINDNSVKSASDILSDCLRWNARYRSVNSKIDAVIIDYLQLMAPENSRQDRRNAIGESSRMCKIMAKKLNCPVVLLSQLSRANELRNDKRPQLSDLRDSGEIEQNADVVMFVHREEYYNPETENKGVAEIIIAKCRDGETGQFEVNWNRKITKFSEIRKE